MSKISVFSPDTLVNTTVGKPFISMNRKSGLISISGAALEKHLGTEKKFKFAFDEENKQGYILPSPDGFEFRENNKSKGLAYNNTALVRQFLTACDIPQSVTSNSIKFLVASDPDALSIEGGKSFPLITIK